MADRWWLVAGRRNEGRREAVYEPGCSREPLIEEERFTSLLGGSGAEGRSPGSMGAVEPSCENAMEPLEHDTEGEMGPGLVSRLEGCELEMVERRLTQDALLEGGRLAVFWSLVIRSPGGV